MITRPELSHKSSMIDYGKARIFLAQGNYSEALDAITLMIEKELSQHTKSKASRKKMPLWNKKVHGLLQYTP